MAQSTNIEWADAVGNPVRGCTRVSPGCGLAHAGGCYAERMASRQSGPGQAYEGLVKSTSAGPRWTGKIRMVPELLQQPLHWRKPRRIFVNSMSDLFHEDVPIDFIQSIWDVMIQTGWHTYLILTKRPERMLEIVPHLRYPLGLKWMDLPAKHIWLGVSVESPEYLWRVDTLMEIPAAMRWVSAEPLLTDLGDLSPYLGRCSECRDWVEVRRQEGHQDHRCPVLRRGTCGIDWVVVGGESGHGARPCSVAWIRGIVQQCQAAGVACFVKQLGTRPVWNHIVPGCSVREFLEPLNLRDSKGADPAEWPQDLRVREWPEESIDARS